MEDTTDNSYMSLPGRIISLFFGYSKDYWAHDLTDLVENSHNLIDPKASRVYISVPATYMGMTGKKVLLRDSIDVEMIPDFPNDFAYKTQDMIPGQRVVAVLRYYRTVSDPFRIFALKSPSVQAPNRQYADKPELMPSYANQSG